MAPKGQTPEQTGETAMSHDQPVHLHVSMLMGVWSVQHTYELVGVTSALQS